uniref:SET domain-containing protein n=1 Tax=Rhabditophanes sp. KR3021 TaxID=114890 RepID=A0AC35TZZ1_9BILA
MSPLTQTVKAMPKTTILLLHKGTPTSLYHAKEHLVEKLYHEGINQRLLSSFFVDKFLKFNKSLIRTINEGQNGICRDETLVKELESELGKMKLPWSPFRVENAYAYSKPSFEEVLDTIVKQKGTERLVAMDMTCGIGDETKSAPERRVNVYLDEKTDLIDFEETRFKVTKGHPVSFDFTFVKGWLESEFVIDYWANRITNLNKGEEMIVFTIPYTQYKLLNEEGMENYRGLCQKIVGKLGFAFTWRISYYREWDDLSLWFNLDEVSAVVKNQKKHGVKKMLVVPLVDCLSHGNKMCYSPNLRESESFSILKPCDNQHFETNLVAKILAKHLIDD